MKQSIVFERCPRIVWIALIVACLSSACVQRGFQVQGSTVRDSASGDSSTGDSTAARVPPWSQLVLSTPKEARLAMYPLSQELIGMGRTLLARPESVEGKQFASIIDPLIREARKDLERAPRHVLQKKETPGWDKLASSISGLLPRDYVSFARYAWPDPAKPNSLPYKVIDGKVNRELIDSGDSSALYGTLRMLERLSFAYAYTGEDVFARKADMLLEAWFLDPTTGMTPHLRYGQMRLGDTQGTPWGLIDVRGFYALPEILNIFSTSSLFRKSTTEGLKAWFRSWFEWLESDPNGLKEIAAKNNHGSFMALQRITWARDTNDGTKALHLCEKLANLSSEQIAPDGSQPLEARRADSFNYHVFNLHALLLGNEICRKEGVDLWKATPLPKAVAYTMPTLLEGAPWPLTRSKAFDEKSFRETIAMLRWNRIAP